MVLSKSTSSLTVGISAKNNLTLDGIGARRSLLLAHGKTLTSCNLSAKRPSTF